MKILYISLKRVRKRGNKDTHSKRERKSTKTDKSKTMNRMCPFRVRERERNGRGK